MDHVNLKHFCTLKNKEAKIHKQNRLPIYGCLFRFFLNEWRVWCHPLDQQIWGSRNDDASHTKYIKSYLSSEIIIATDAWEKSLREKNVLYFIHIVICLIMSLRLTAYSRWTGCFLSKAVVILLLEELKIDTVEAGREYFERNEIAFQEESVIKPFLFCISKTAIRFSQLVSNMVYNVCNTDIYMYIQPKS